MTARILLALLLGLLWFGAPSIARAQSCGVSTTAMDFGAYNAMTASNHDVNGTVQVYCIIQTVSVQIGLDKGITGTFAARRMTSGANFMTYQLYTNAARTIVWGDGSGTTQTITRTTGSSANGCTGGTSFIFVYVNCPVYGRIPPSQNVAAGDYDDTVTVTITF